MPILALPSDILILIIRSLGVDDLLALMRTCRSLNALVSEFGWDNYLRLHPRPSSSLVCARFVWDPRMQVRYDFLTDKAWDSAEFVACPLSHPWQGKLQPLLAINSSRFIVAAGNILHCYQFVPSSSQGEAPGVRFEGTCALSERRDARQDITGIVFAQESDATLFVGFADGRLERITLTSVFPSGKDVPVINSSLDSAFRFNHGDLIESLSCERDRLLSLTSSGIVTLYDVASASSALCTIDLATRSWKAHFCTSSSTPYAIFGTSSVTPLVVHSITESELVAKPSAVLHPMPRYNGNGVDRSSAAYGICNPPASAPWSASDQIIVSGWYDGIIRIHDLRSSAHTSTCERPDAPAPLTPVLSMSNPWSDEPIYTISCGGGSSSQIAAGTARHSLVSFWDVRSPSQGWSVHAPGNDSSPVYSVVLESSRLFGATQSRPFVYDFGPGVTCKTYPQLPELVYRNKPILKRDEAGIGYYVTKYRHNRTRDGF